MRKTRKEKEVPRRGIIRKREGERSGRGQVSLPIIGSIKKQKIFPTHFFSYKRGRESFLFYLHHQPLIAKSSKLSSSGKLNKSHHTIFDRWSRKTLNVPRPTIYFPQSNFIYFLLKTRKWRVIYDWAKFQKEPDPTGLDLRLQLTPRPVRAVKTLQKVFRFKFNHNKVKGWAIDASQSYPKFVQEPLSKLTKLGQTFWPLSHH